MATLPVEPFLTVLEHISSAVRVPLWFLILESRHEADEYVSLAVNDTDRVVHRNDLFSVNTHPPPVMKSAIVPRVPVDVTRATSRVLPGCRVPARFRSTLSSAAVSSRSVPPKSAVPSRPAPTSIRPEYHTPAESGLGDRSSVIRHRVGDWE